MSSILIVTPLALENAALAGALAPHSSHCENLNDGVKLLTVDGASLALALGGHGKVQFALSTQLLIQKCKPSLVICAGAAGALNPELSSLDVVIGDTTIEHDFNLLFAARPLPAFPADPATLEKIKRRLEPRAFRVHFGPLASGDEDVIDPARAVQIRQKTDALAVAWEGAGGARACRMHGIPFVEIRAVTDAADPAAPHHFTQNIKLGMENVAEIIRLIL
jgi:adenosylhomocysteine nucleosidase